MSAMALDDSTVRRLLGEAAEWRLMALLLECPGDGWREQVAALAREVADDTLRQAARAAIEEADEGLYHTIFGPGGPASPREVSYRATLLPGPFLAELAAFYEAFSYRPAIDEPPDHVAVEAGFVGYLRLKAAYAVARGDAEQAAVTAQAAGRILSEHLATIAGPLQKSLAASDIVYLSLTASILARHARSELAAGPGAQPG